MSWSISAPGTSRAAGWPLIDIGLRLLLYFHRSHAIRRAPARASMRGGSVTGPAFAGYADEYRQHWFDWLIYSPPRCRASRVDVRGFSRLIFMQIFAATVVADVYECFDISPLAGCAEDIFRRRCREPDYFSSLAMGFSLLAWAIYYRRRFQAHSGQPYDS